MFLPVNWKLSHDLYYGWVIMMSQSDYRNLPKFFLPDVFFTDSENSERRYIFMLGPEPSSTVSFTAAANNVSKS